MANLSKEERRQIARENGKKGGRPPGSKNLMTLEKEKVAAELQNRIYHVANRLLDSQLTVALGVSYLYKIEKEVITGPRGGTIIKSLPPVLVTDEWEIRDYLQGLVDIENGGSKDYDRAATYYYITTQLPGSHAIDSMLNRGFGRATQSIEVKKVEDDHDEEIKQKSRTALKQSLRRDSGKG